MTRLMIGLGVFVVLAGGSRAIAAPHAKLRKQRVVLAKAALADAQADLRVGRGPAEMVYRWSVRLLHAQSDGANVRSRDAYAAAHLARMRRLAAAVAAKVRAGMARRIAKTAADYYLVEAQLWRARSRAKIRWLPSRSSGP